jgi:protein SCO1/2
VLSDYKASRQLPEAWWWLTGEPEAVLTLVREGFLLGVEENPGDPRDPILHSTRVVLVDGQNRVRGYYDGLEPKDLERLDADLERLAGR